eukprot:tig00021463_g21630.t1
MPVGRQTQIASTSSLADLVLQKLEPAETAQGERSEVLYDLHLYDRDPWGDRARPRRTASSPNSKALPVPIYSKSRITADAARRQMLRGGAPAAPGAADLSGATRVGHAKRPQTGDTAALPAIPARRPSRRRGAASPPRPLALALPPRRALPRLRPVPPQPSRPGPSSPPATPGAGPGPLKPSPSSPASPGPSPNAPAPGPASPGPPSPSRNVTFLDHFYHIHQTLLESAERARLEAEERAAREARLEDILIAKLQRRPKPEQASGGGGDTYEDRMLARLLAKRAEARRAAQRTEEEEDPEKASAAAKARAKLRKEWVWKLVEALKSGDERHFLTVYDQVPASFSREELVEMKGEARERALHSDFGSLSRW